MYHVRGVRCGWGAAGIVARVSGFRGGPISTLAAGWAHTLSHDARLAATAAAMADSPKRRFRSKAAGVKAEQPQASGASEVASISGGSALGETVALAPAVPGEFAGDPPAEALLEPPPPPIPFPPCLWHAWWPLLV